MNKLFECTVLIAVLTAVGAAPVCAAEGGKKKDLGKFGVWRAFVYEEGGQTVCYMATTRAGKTTPKNKGRVPYLMITHRPVEGSTDVFSYGAGISLDSKHNAQLKMGKDSFELFSVKENAWARDSITDHKIAAAVRKSSEAKVVSIPAQGRATTIGDKFPLTGAAMAYRAISKACGVPDYDVKKPEIKKPPSKKPEAKKRVIKKAVTKKPVASKTTAKKSETKKPVIKKAIVKKPVALKTTAKKPVAKVKTTVKSKTTK